MHTVFNNKKLLRRLSIVSILSLSSLFLSPFVQLAYAAPFDEASMRLDRMTASTADNDILIVVKPTTVATEASMQVVFASGFAVDSTPSNVTVSSAGIPSTYQGESLTAWPGIGSAATAVSGQTVTIASTDLTVGTLYGFFITAGIDNPGSTGQYVNTVRTRTSGTATIDESDVAVRIITDDQIDISATVPATFNFTLGANSDAFTADLSASSIVSTTGVTVTVATNAQNGWIAWLRSANAGLDSATTSATIDTQGSVDDACTTFVNGSDYYQLDVDLTTDGNGSGTINVDDEYDCATTSGGTFSTTYEEIAISSGTTDGDVITLIGRATITATKPAADDYTDTWTVVGAGNF
jgi:hypothetical protein